MNGVTQWFATWLIVIIGMTLLVRTDWGRPLVYGLLWLAIVLLLVTHADEVNSIFSLEALQLNG
jgi:hypothetical protein